MSGMQLNWEVKKFAQLTAREVFEIFKARESVFVVEQKCPYHEIDGNDLKSLHVYAVDDDQQIVAYARIFKEENAVTFGRVLANPKYRGQGIGKALISEVLRVIGKTVPGEPIMIEAQEYIQPLYAYFGFKKTSETYLIDNIPHVRMAKKVV